MRRCGAWSWPTFPTSCRVGVGRERGSRPGCGRCGQPRAGHLALRPDARPHLADEGRRPDSPPVVCPTTWATASTQPSRWPPIYPWLALEWHRRRTPAAGPGHPRVGPRGRLAVSARARVAGRRLCPDALGERLPDLLRARSWPAKSRRPSARVSGSHRMADAWLSFSGGHGALMDAQRAPRFPTQIKRGWSGPLFYLAGNARLGLGPVPGELAHPAARMRPVARTKADPTVVRPRCPEHPGNRVWLDGFERCRWSDAHRRPRYRCVTLPGTRGHSFSLPVAVRQPTERHPDSGAACPTCEHVYGRHEGVRTGRDCVFGHQEIARLLLRVGEGMSLRARARNCAGSVFRFCRRHRLTPPRGGRAGRQANLAVDYLDAFAPAVVAALLPTRWPRSSSSTRRPSSPAAIGRPRAGPRRVVRRGAGGRAQGGHGPGRPRRRRPAPGPA